MSNVAESISNPPGRRRWELVASAGILVVGLLWAVWCSTLPQLGVNAASRFATMEALVEHGEWSIDNASLLDNTIDKVQWEGRFYSSKPPLMAAIGAPIYRLVSDWYDVRFSTDMYRTASLMRLPLAVLPWWVGCVFMFVALGSVSRSPAVRVWGLASWTLASLPMAYAADLNNHTWAVSAMMLCLAVLAPIAAHPEKRTGTARAAIAGAAAGTVVCFDLGAVPIMGMLGLIVVWRWLGERNHRALAAAVVAASVLPIVQAAIQYSIVGDIVPFYLKPGAYAYDGSYWARPSGFDALNEPKATYFFHATFGHHGLFSHSPWLMLALPWIFSGWRDVTGPVGPATWMRRVHRQFMAQPETALKLAAVIGLGVVVLYYTFKSRNYGGLCVGMRWFMVTQPVLALAAVHYVEQHRLMTRVPGLLAALTTVGAVVCLWGTVSVWGEGLIFVIFRGLGMGSING
jgi:hypothetical protein